MPLHWLHVITFVHFYIIYYSLPGCCLYSVRIFFIFFKNAFVSLWLVSCQCQAAVFLPVGEVPSCHWEIGLTPHFKTKCVIGLSFRSTTNLRAVACGEQVHAPMLFLFWQVFSLLSEVLWS